jgi:hypothetical protein
MKFSLQWSFKFKYLEKENSSFICFELFLRWYISLDICDLASWTKLNDYFNNILTAYSYSNDLPLQSKTFD